jgi:DNA-binding PadR family transcriptional regulator
MTPPVFAHGHLRLYLLSLLAERPMHGYELIQALTDRFGGTYVPSAGTIYPRLAKLEEDGLVTKESEGRKTVYSTTDAGRAELSSRDGELGGIEDELSDSVRRLANEVRASVTDAMKTLRADLAAAARDAGADALARRGPPGRTAGRRRPSAGSDRPARRRGSDQRLPPAAAHRPPHGGRERAPGTLRGRAPDVAVDRAAARDHDGPSSLKRFP